MRSGATTCPSTCTSTTKLSVMLALQPSMVTLLIFIQKVDFLVVIPNLFIPNLFLTRDFGVSL